MKIHSCLAWTVALAAIVIAIPAASAATLSTGFSYQGRLFDAGNAANGQYEMEFILRDQAMGGNQVGTVVSIAPVTVTNGLFQVTVDFGTNVWDGNSRWLDVSVRTNGSSAPSTLLTPSQLIQPVPYAIHSIKAGQLVGALPSTQLSGSYPNPVTLNNAANAFGGNGSGLTSLNAGQLATGTVPDARLASAVTRDTELLAVSNLLSAQIDGNNSVALGVINSTSNGLSSRLEATNSVLVGLLNNGDSNVMFFVNLNSNLLNGNIGFVGSVLGAFTNQLQTGNNTFSGTNEFLGHTVLTNGVNVLGGDGSRLTGLNGSQITGGTVADARIAATLARDSEMLSVSNALRSQLDANEIATAGALTTVTNGLSARLVATNAALLTALDATNSALMSKLTTSSNALQTAIDNEAAARGSLATMLQTGDNSFAGSNHFSGIVTLTNASNVMAGDGSALTALTADAIASGTISAARLPGNVVLDDGEVGVSLQGSLTAPSFSGNGGNLTSLNASQLSTGTVPDARLDAAITRDTELNSVSNSLAVSLDATNSALMTKLTTSSNALQTAIDNEAAVRGSLATMLQTGDNSFAGSNHFSGIVTLTNASNVMAGDGSALTSLNADAIASGTISAARLPGNVVLDDGEVGVSLQGSLTAPSFSGNGGNLTSLNASQLSSGTVSDARLSGNIPRLDSQLTTFIGPVTASGFTGDGSALTSLNANNLSSGTIPLGRLPSEVLIDNDGSVSTEAFISASGFNGLGSGLTSLNASQLSSGTVSDDRLSANVTRLDGTNVFTGTNRFSGETILTNTANVIAGNGSALTALNADNLNSGTISTARLPGDVVLDDGEVGVTLQGALTAPSFSGSGGNLTSLNASQLSSGTVPDGRLAGNIPRLDAQATTFVGPVTASGFTGSGTDLTGLNASSISSGTLSSARLPAGVVIDDIQSGVTLQGPLSAPSVSGDGAGLTGLNASQLTSGTVADGRLSANVARLDGTNVLTGTNRFAGEVILTNTANTIVGTFSGNGAGLTGIPLTVLTGTVQDSQLNGTYSQNLTLSGGNTHSGANVFSSSNHFSGIFVATNSANVINGDGAGLTGLWKTGGNSGTTPGTDFIGTSDNQALEFKVNGERALRIAPDGQGFGSPNFLGGSSANTLGSGVEGAVIAGGGASNLPEIGAKPNSILADYGVIGGGYDNTIQASAGSSVIGGGENNEVEPNTPWSVIAGGGNNVIGSNKFAVTISGGSGNEATNRYAVVPGGRDNRAGGDYSFAAGRRAKADNDGAFVWADSQNSDFTSSANNSFNVRASGGANFTVGSFQINGNDVQTTATAPSLSGDNTLSGNNVFSSSNHFSGVFVATNTANVLNGNGAGLSGLWRLGGNTGTTPGTDFIGTTDDQPFQLHANGARVLRLEPALTDSAPNILAGSVTNHIDTGVRGATVAGGGSIEEIEGTEYNANLIRNGANFGTVSGGKDNVILDNSYGAVVSGGEHNHIRNNASQSVIGGGNNNFISTNSTRATIAGGSFNQVSESADYSTISGGRFSSVSANAQYSVISGGRSHVIGTNAVYATIAGGFLNTAAGNYSYAAGRRAKAAHAGAFVWADSQNSDFFSTAIDSFNVRAQGGANFTVGSFQINGSAVQTTATAPSLSGDNTLSGNNVFSSSNHFSGIFVATNTANVINGDGTGLSGLWRLGGNTGTTPGTDFIGSADNQALVFKANNQQIMRLTPAPDEGAPNVVLGAEINTVGSGIFGATISGGGASSFMNEGTSSNIVNANYSTIGGGVGHVIHINGYAGTIAGGIDNLINTNGDRSTIGGGTGNSVGIGVYAGTIAGGGNNSVNDGADYGTIGGGRNNQAGGGDATVAGGQANQAGGSGDFVGGGALNISSGSAYGVIAGGFQNTNTAQETFIGSGRHNLVSGAYGVVPGGISNVVTGFYGFAAGRQARSLHQGAFVWADAQGGEFASGANNTFNVRAAGGANFTVGSFQINGSDALTSGTGARLSSPNAFTANNTFAGSNYFSEVLVATNSSSKFGGDGSALTGLWKTGGNSGTTPGTDFIGTTDNQAFQVHVNNERAFRLELNGDSAPNVIGGSSTNHIDAGVRGATIAGGGSIENIEGTEYNPNLIRSGAHFATISGGKDNLVSTNAVGSVIAGGYNNQIRDSASESVIVGGYEHQIRADASESVIVGGYNHRISEDAFSSAIVGGASHVISSNAWNSVISGGEDNLIGTNAQFAMIPGGADNRAAGKYSFAAGRNAKANHDGAFVWADSNTTNLNSEAANTFNIRAMGGIHFTTGSDQQTESPLFFVNGDPVIPGGPASDRNLKKNFEAVDKVAVLEKLAALEITRWNYKTDEDGATKHIGPMLQDFKPAFYPGREQDKIITWQEMHGVELAAIQGLNQKLESKLKEKDEQLADLRKELDALKQLVQAMAKSGGAQ